MAESKGMKIQFEADDTKLRSALNRIEKEGKSLQKSLKEIDKLLEFDPTNTQLLAQKQELLAKAVENTREKLSAMDRDQSKIAEGHKNWEKNREAIEANAEKIKELSEKLGEYSKEVTKAQKAADQGLISKEELEKTKQAYSDIQAELKKVKAEQNKLKGSDGLVSENMYQRYRTDAEALRIGLQQLGQQQAQVSATIADGGRSAQEAALAEEAAARAAEEEARVEAERKRVIEAAAEAEKKAKKAADDYKNSLDGLKTAANNVKNDVKSMTSLMATGVAAVSAAVIKGTKDVSKVGMEFTKSMSNVEALSGATVSELNALRDAAADAGASTSKTASQSADALGYMALAGWDTTEMLKGLMPVLRASEAGSMDLARCSDLVTDSMSAMGIAVDDLQHYLDVCTKTQSSANTSMEQLLQAYVSCGGMLKNLNVPMEESAAILGTLANRGIKGAEAGNALNSVLINLIGANKNAASAMKEMGISAFDSNGKFIGLENTLKLVKSKIDEYGDDMERISKLEAKLGGKTQFDTLMALLSGVSEEFDELEVKISDCNGALEKTAQTMQDNLTGDITAMKSALEGVENTIFSSLEEPFRSASQNATQELRKLNAACSEGELADSLKKIAESAGEMLSKLAEFAAEDAFPTLISWLEWIASHSDSIIASITGVGAAWGTWKLGKLLLDLNAFRVKLIETVAEHKKMIAAEAEEAATRAAKTAATTADTAAQATNTAAEVANTTAQAANTAASAANATATAADTTSTAANTAATGTNTTSEIANTAAQAANTAAVASNTAATVADTAATTANTTATGANTAAQAASTAAQATGTAATIAGTTATAAASLTLKDFAAAAISSQAAVLGVAGVIAALIAIIGKLILTYKEAELEEKNRQLRLDETTQALYDQASAYEANAKAAKENAAKADETAEATKKAWEEVKKYAEENDGSAASVENLKRAVERLNAVSGLNIEVVDGQIKGYEELCATMDDYIEKTRRSAKLSYLHDSYAEAVANIDETEKAYQEAYQKRLDAYNAMVKAQKSLDAGEADAIANGAFGNLDDLRKEAEATKKSFEDAATAYDAYAKQYTAYKGVIDQYEDIAFGSKPEYEGKSFYEQYVEEQTQKAKQAADDAAKAQEDAYNDFLTKMDELDHQKAIHAFDNEEDYWKERRKLLDENRFTEDEKWHKINDDTVKHYEELSEKERKAYEDDLKERIEALKERQETDEQYTKEMLYNDIEALISGLGKQSDIYKKYNKEIIKGRKDLAKESAKAVSDGLKEEVKDIESALKSEISNYQNSLKSIKSQKDAYFNKLFDTSDFTAKSKQTDENGKEAEVFSLADPNKAYQKLLKYKKSLEELQKKEVGEDLINWIKGLDQETAQNTMDVLNHMSEKQLKDYTTGFNNYKKEAMGMADTEYADEIDKLNEGFVQKVDSILDGLPDEAKRAGMDTARGFIEGINSGDDVDAAVKAFTDKIVNGIKENLDIHSPSKETKSLGEYAAEGFVNGLASEDVSGAVEDFTSTIIDKLKQKDPDIRAAMENALTDNLDMVLGDMEAAAEATFGRIISVFSATVPLLPDITKLSLPNFDSMTSAAGNFDFSEISLKLDKLDKLDAIIALIQSISVTTANGQTIKIQLELDGRLVADMDNITAIISKKQNNIAIQTGKQVFSY